MIAASVVEDLCLRGALYIPYAFSDGVRQLLYARAIAQKSAFCDKDKAKDTSPQRYKSKEASHAVGVKFLSRVKTLFRTLFASRSPAFRAAVLVVAGGFLLFALSLASSAVRESYWGIAQYRVINPLQQRAQMKHVARQEAALAKKKSAKRDALREAGSLSSPYVEVGADESFPLLVRVWLNVDPSHTARVSNKDERFPLVYDRAVSAQGFVPVVGLTFGDNSFDVEIHDADGNKVAQHRLSAKIEDKEDVRGWLSVKKKAVRNDFVSAALAWGRTNNMPRGRAKASYYGVIDDLGDIRWFMRVEGERSERLSRGLMHDDRIFLTHGFHKIFVSDVFGNRKLVFDGKKASPERYNYRLHHDYTVTDKGTMLLLVDPFTKEGNRLSKEDTIVEVDLDSGKTIREIDLKNLLSDIFDFTVGPKIEDYALVSKRKQDWMHLNSIAYDAASQTIILSGRNQSAVFALNYETEKLEWIFANPEGLTKQQRAQFLQAPAGYVFHKGQHDARIEGNRLRFFDNAVLVKKPDGSYTDPETTPSRIVEARLDLANKKITAVKTYVPKPIFSKITSGYEFRDGKYLICYCGILKDAFGGYITDVRNMKGAVYQTELFEFKEGSNRELSHVSIKGGSFRPRYFDWKKMVGAK